MPLLRLPLAFLVAAAAAVQAAPPPLVTAAEESGWRRTGRYDEVVRLCDDFPRAYPGRVRKIEFGTTPEGRTMLALVASTGKALDPATCRAKGVPVLLFQGGIHAGEIDGKDAGFWALRDMLDGRLAPGALGSVTVVFVPVFNVDGHERFGPNNRPNQTGPEEMGWRTTAQNYNLNRDYVKADAPEMQAMLRLLNEWDPVALVDLHVTDGAEFQVDLGVMVDPAHQEPPELCELGRVVRRGIRERLTTRGWLVTPYYPAFKDDSDPKSGFSRAPFGARFSNGYWASRGRLGILVETHSWKPYDRRVRMTHDAIADLVEMAAADGKAWLDVVHRADEADARLAGLPVNLAWENTKAAQRIEFPGYEYERHESSILARTVVTYDTSKPQTWVTPMFDEVKPAVTVRAPRAGYVVPVAEAPWLSGKLALHGLSFQRIDAPATLDVEAFRATKATFATAPFEGHFATTVEGAWAPEKRSLPAGSLFVPIAQPRARLLMTLLEPTDPESLLAWGFFPTAFEKKEYLEPYVAETIANEMMAKDPALAAEFLAKVASDGDFRGSAEKRLDFFYSRHPTWDERLNLYPVLRVDAAPVPAAEERSKANRRKPR